MRIGHKQQCAAHRGAYSDSRKLVSATRGFELCAKLLRSFCLILCEFKIIGVQAICA